jgi:hypothetical protein
MTDDEITSLNAAAPGSLCHECSSIAVACCPWPVHQPGEPKARYCGRTSCAKHSHIIIDTYGKGRLPGLCLEHRNVVLEARAHRAEILTQRRQQQQLLEE